MNEGANLFAVLFFSVAAAVRACWNEGRVRGSWGPISRSPARCGPAGCKGIEEGNKGALRRRFEQKMSRVAANDSVE